MKQEKSAYFLLFPTSNWIDFLLAYQGHEDFTCFERLYFLGHLFFPR